MLSVVVFGVVCELTDDDPCQPEPQDADAPTPKTTEATERAAAVEPNTAPAPRRSRRRHAAAPMTPRWWRWRETHRRRRREHPHISFTEFADLSDSRRVILRSDRGFSWSWRHKPDPWSGITRESLADSAAGSLPEASLSGPCSLLMTSISRLHWLIFPSQPVRPMTAVVPKATKAAAIQVRIVMGRINPQVRRACNPVLSFAMSSPSPLVWVDLEMTGLNPESCVIVEIATLITDAKLDIVAEGPNLVVSQPDSALDAMDDFVRNMHTRSGLLERIKTSEVTLADAEEQTLAFVKEHISDARTAPLCGNSIWKDRQFIERYMPELDGFLHYRNIDVSTIKELAKRWYADSGSPPRKAETHRALDDIRESIAELRWYRHTVFK